LTPRRGRQAQPPARGEWSTPLHDTDRRKEEEEEEEEEEEDEEEEEEEEDDD
jgi:hypothetical protein